MTDPGLFLLVACMGLNKSKALGCNVVRVGALTNEIKSLRGSRGAQRDCTRLPQSWHWPEGGM